MAGQTAANQWLERTLDDSAARRLYLPQSFLGVDAILRLVGKIAKGLEVNAAVIARNVAVVLPYIATENILMAVVAAGGNRQTAHERIRFHSQQVTANLKAGAMTNDLIDRLKADREFANVEMDALTDSRGFVGRAVEQVDEFNLNVIESIRRNYPHRPHSNDDIEV